MCYTPRERALLQKIERSQNDCLARMRARVEAVTAAGTLTPRSLLPLFIEAFEASSVPGCDRVDDGDALLAQWGAYHFGGALEYQFDLTRQFIVTVMEDGPMTHLKATFYYDPREIPPVNAGNIWSFAHAELLSFREAVEGQAGFQAVADLPARRFVLGLDPV